MSIPSAVTLGPGETHGIAYRIEVPSDADGTYVGVILITPSGATSPSAAVGGSAGDSVMTLRQVLRYAVELVVDVAGGSRSAVVFRYPALLLEGGGVPRLEVSAHNRGVRWAPGVRYQFDFYDAISGAFVASKPSDRGRLYPGAEHRVAVDLVDLQPGAYQLLVIADADGNDLFAIRYSLDLPSQSAPVGPAVGP
jgi:hypothetical protein